MYDTDTGIVLHRPQEQGYRNRLNHKQGLVNFLHKGPGSKCIRLCRLCGFCHPTIDNMKRNVFQ